MSDKAWEYAELGLLEYRTSKLLADEIEGHGFKVVRGVAEMPPAFTATWGSGGPTLGVLGELDALAGIDYKPVKQYYSYISRISTWCKYQRESS